MVYDGQDRSSEFVCGALGLGSAAVFDINDQTRGKWDEIIASAKKRTRLFRNPPITDAARAKWDRIIAAAAAKNKKDALLSRNSISSDAANQSSHSSEDTSTAIKSYNKGGEAQPRSGGGSGEGILLPRYELSRRAGEPSTIALPGQYVRRRYSTSPITSHYRRATPELPNLELPLGSDLTVGYATRVDRSRRSHEPREYVAAQSCKHQFAYPRPPVLFYPIRHGGRFQPYSPRRTRMVQLYWHDTDESDGSSERATAVWTRARHLYGLCHESRALALGRYGQPSRNWVPFNPGVDSIQFQTDDVRRHNVIYYRSVLQIDDIADRAWLARIENVTIQCKSRWVTACSYPRADKRQHARFVRFAREYMPNLRHLAIVLAPTGDCMMHDSDPTGLTSSPRNGPNNGNTMVIYSTVILGALDSLHEEGVTATAETQRQQQDDDHHEEPSASSSARVIVPFAKLKTFSLVIDRPRRQRATHDRGCTSWWANGAELIDHIPYVTDGSLPDLSGFETYRRQVRQWVIYDRDTTPMCPIA
ncbi:hypothetical protein B0H63DRAFT_444098 [Podospora didyma]|uniref:Uncharacterized protein n=1 Tax=Podospora didyma TaxID=330526 RepID=A0AAE0U7X8_9PEZI|nr:hypothetical protein B0H63DRAFT_444098 [Podospora didyma]